MLLLLLHWLSTAKDDGAQEFLAVHSQAEALRRLRQPPPGGWLRCLRRLSGISTVEMARRLGISQTAGVQYEKGEVAETVTLATLRRAADALDADLVYVLVPRQAAYERIWNSKRPKDLDE